MIDSKLSKIVGWDNNHKVFFPKNVEEVTAASDTQVLEWYRFLPSAETKEELEMQNAVYDEYMLRKV